MTHALELCPCFEVDISRCGGTATLRIGGELDIMTGEELRERLAEELTEDPERLVIDLSGTSFIDCSGARVLFNAAQRIRAAGGEVVICSAKPLALFVLEAFGFEDLSVDGYDVAEVGGYC